MEQNLKKLLIATALVFLAVISSTLIADIVMKPETYGSLIVSIDDKKDTVMGLAAASTVASAGISAIPDDTATPIADKLADLSGYFLLVLCALYAEKYLITIVGAVVFRVLIPLACVFCIVSLFRNTQNLRRLALKLTVIGLLLALAIPVSIGTSDMVYDIYDASINGTIASAEEFSEELNAADEDAGWWERLTGTVSGVINKASGILSRFVEALAVIIVSACLIPVLSLLFFLWLIKLLIGSDFLDKLIPPLRGPVLPPHMPDMPPPPPAGPDAPHTGETRNKR